MRAVGVGTRGSATGRTAFRASRAASIVLLTLACLASAVAAQDAVAAPSRVAGIDVSMWQGEVDWAEVASSTERFVIMRATRGHDFIDPRYTEYLAGATANGLVVGAYHRAKPSLAEGDAVAEADFFLDVARNAAGDVLPVLDIEETGGLTPGQLADWVRAWTARVRIRTGVRAMLYASPYFWRTNMGDTTWFADRGHRLWIAHWGAPEPNVPAQNWGGRGWTFWQWTAGGSVPGIVGDVDRDVFDGASLAHGRIASVIVTPAAGGVIEGPRIACGGGQVQCDRLADPGAVLTLTATPDPGAVLLGWTGACRQAGAAPTCEVTALRTKTVSAIFGHAVDVDRRGTGSGVVSSSPPGVECGTVCSVLVPTGTTLTLRAEPDSASVFTSWSDGCAGADPSCSITVSSPTRVVAGFDSVVSAEEDGAGTGYAWGSATDARAIGGSYRWERRATAWAAYPFSGDAVTLFTIAGPAMGKARVAVDGVTMAILNGYAPSFWTRRHRFDGFGAGGHTLTVTVLGTKRPAATGTNVVIDALRWDGRLRADPRGQARWASPPDPSASGGTYAISDVRAASARLRFHGTGVSLRTVRGPGMGRAEVWVDGIYERTVDLYRPTRRFTLLEIVSGLTDGPHAVKVVVTGTHRPASAGSAVVVDRWIVV